MTSPGDEAENASDNEDTTKAAGEVEEDPKG
jgi:hypothetical protein